MTPDTARRLLEAWRNHRRPGRTHAARVRDALAHVHQSTIKKPAEKHISQDGLKGIRHENNSTPDPQPHL